MYRAKAAERVRGLLCLVERVKQMNTYDSESE